MSITKASFNFSTTRRDLLKVTAAGVFLGSTGLPIVARAEGQINMMGWADSVSPDNLSAWEKDSGTKVVYDPYASNDEMFSKLQLSRGNSGYDVGMATDYMIKLLIDQNMIEKIDPSLIANMANIDPQFANPDFDPSNAHTIPKSSGSQGFIYDKSVITRSMKTWQDFLDAIENEASGQVSLLDDPLAIAPLFWSKGLSWNTTEESALKDAEARVETLAKHVKMFNSYPVQDVANGSVILAQIWNGNAKQAIDAANNENLVFVYPEPKSELWVDSYYIPAGAKNIGAAHSWMNYVLDPKVAAREIAYTGFLSPVSGVKPNLKPADAGSALIFPPADALARGERTVRNSTYDRRIQILTKFKASAVQ